MQGANQLDDRSMLVSLPKLESWYRAIAPHPPSITDAENFHLFTLTKALHVPTASRCRTWTRALEHIILVRPSLLQHILDTDSLAVTLGTSVIDLYGILAELAVRNEEGMEAFNALEKLANKTKLAAFGFLAAWTAFNINDLELCIRECEKVHEPFAPVHTLLGQALLESGKIPESIEALNVAIQISPSDPLPLVQLIKAYLVSGLQKESISTIDKCRRIVGSNIEIECLAAMAITSGNHRPKDFCEKTLTNIAEYLTADPSDIAAFQLGMELAAELCRKDWATCFADRVDFSKIEDPRDVASNLAKILKKNAELHWLDISTLLLNKAISLTQSRDLNPIMQ